MSHRVRVLDASSKISAVKLVREMTGFGLRESLDHVEAKSWFSVDKSDAALRSLLEEAARVEVSFEFDPPFDASSLAYASASPTTIEAGGVLAIRYRSGPNKIHAIKLVRELTSLGLLESKTIVEEQGLVRVGLADAEARRIVMRFHEIESVVEVEQVAAASSSPAPSRPSSTTSATAKPATPATPSRRAATPIYGQASDDDDF